MPIRAAAASCALMLAACAARPSSAAGGGATDGFRDSFAVRKDELRAAGASPWFSLTPGTKHVYRDGDETVTIRVLDETREVDGVTTRVVEEREEVGGALREISHNFLAIDPATGDVYYFGEDVDHYRDGRVRGHGGAWRAGEKGARFGLAMPGRPAVGDRFYQELAPDVAMDRAEIVGVDERIETPAGAFTGCVHVKESTPLEKDAGHKWYAPGVGLVKDGDAVLVSREPQGR